jgi:hypothetical protein
MRWHRIFIGAGWPTGFATAGSDLHHGGCRLADGTRQNLAPPAVGVEIEGVDQESPCDMNLRNACGRREDTYPVRCHFQRDASCVGPNCCRSAGKVGPQIRIKRGLVILSA